MVMVHLGTAFPVVVGASPRLRGGVGRKLCPGGCCITNSVSELFFSSHFLSLELYTTNPIKFIVFFFIFPIFLLSVIFNVYSLFSTFLLFIFTLSLTVQFALHQLPTTHFVLPHYRFFLQRLGITYSITASHHAVPKVPVKADVTVTTSQKDI